MKKQIKKMLLPVSRGVVANVELPGSKSICNRALLMASLSSGVTILKNILFSDDVNSCVQAIKELGIRLDINYQDRTVKVYGCSGEFSMKNASLNMNDAGTLTRFLIPICASQIGGVYHFHGSKRMMERPISDLLKHIQSLGCRIEYLETDGCMPFKMYTNGLLGGKLTIEGDKSSQFLSGMLLASPLAKDLLTLSTNVTHNQPYVEMTKKMMADFGVNTSINGNNYEVPIGGYSSIEEYWIEPDISTASYFWAVAAITQGSIRVMNTSYSSLQGDIKFLEVLEKMGCTITETSKGIMVSMSKDLKSVNINMRDFSDTFMTVLAIVSFTNETSLISGLSHTRFQESNRIEAMGKELSKLGVNVKTTDDSIEVTTNQLSGAIVSGHNDHRIAMSLALIGLKISGVIIDGAECVSKTCPDFFERMLDISDGYA